MRFLCFAAILILGSAAQASSLRAGVAKVDITPPPGEQMWGYEGRTQGATGTLDPLYARILVLEAGQKRLALVTLDLGRSFGPASLDRLRKSAQGNGINCILVTASHTHSGPVVQDDYRNGTPAWERAALSAIENALKAAADHLADVRIGVGYGDAYIGHNRLKVTEEATVSWFEINPTKIPTAPVDPTVSVLRVDKADGSPLAVLVNYSCHPVVFGPDNLQYSADYPGVMTHVVETALGPGPMAFFLQGAPGDINPYYAVTPIKEDAIARRDWTGKTLGDAAAQIAKRIHTEPQENASIDFVEEQLPMHIRWDIEGFRLGLKRFLGDAYDKYAGAITPDLNLPVATVLINRTIALTTMPGEPFVDFQVNWRQRCPVRDAFFLGYTNGYFGYSRRSGWLHLAVMVREAPVRGWKSARANEWSIRQ